jgi:hypothetical protein
MTNFDEIKDEAIKKFGLEKVQELDDDCNLIFKLYEQQADHVAVASLLDVLQGENLITMFKSVYLTGMMSYRELMISNGVDVSVFEADALANKGA